MKKITSSVLALLIAASLTACGEKAPDTAGETSAAAATKSETSASSEAETEETKAEETETETTTEKTEEEPVMSEKDKLIEDIVREASENYEKYYHEYYYNNNTLIYTGDFGRNYGTFFIDTESFTGKELTDKYSDDWFTFYTNGNLYSLYCDFFRSIDYSGNTIAEFLYDPYQVGSSFFLEDGNVLLETHNIENDQTIWGIFSPKLELIRELPKLTADAGHGTTEDLDIYDVYTVYGNTAYVQYKGGSYKRIDLDTFEILEPDNPDGNDFRYTNNSRYLLAGKYWYSSENLYNLETGEVTEDIFNKYSDIFATEKAFYFVTDSKLYRYISEEESELVYDGSINKSAFRAVSEDHFLVCDNLGMFLVDMKTGEEHKVEINS